MKNSKTCLLVFCLLAVFHIAVSLSLNALAKSSYLTGYHNAEGLWNFAYDSFSYHVNAVNSAKYVDNEGLLWLMRQYAQFHEKLITLVYHIAGPNPIYFAPVNAFVWAAGVICVYFIASLLVGDKKKHFAWTCALVYGMWPSSLAFSTQLLKEPFFNLGCVALILGWVSFMRGKSNIWLVLVASTGFALVSGVREQLAYMFIGMMIIGTVFVLWKARSAAPHALSCLVIASIILLTPDISQLHDSSKQPDGWGIKIDPSESQAEIKEKKERKVAKAKAIVASGMGPEYQSELDHLVSAWFYDSYNWYRAGNTYEEKKDILLVLKKRHGSDLPMFLENYMTPWRYSDYIPDSIERLLMSANQYRDSFLTKYLQPSDSTLDDDILFRSVSDIARYLPRAALIGFFAPFPNHWIERGKTGGAVVRALSGMEMIITYLLIAGFIFYLINSHTPWWIKTWLVLFTVVMVMPLGLFVPNLGSLYRMRFIYLVPVIIGGMEGLRLIYQRTIMNNSKTAPKF